MPVQTAGTIGPAAKRYLAQYPGEAARALESFPASDVSAVLSHAAHDSAAPVLEALMPSLAARVLESLHEDSVRRILPTVDASRAAVIVSHLDDAARERVLGLLDEPVAKEIRSILNYPRDSAGHIMDPRPLMFRADATVKEALSEIRKMRRRVSDVLLVHEDGRLAGSVMLQEMAVAAPSTALKDVVQAPAVPVGALTPREDILAEFEQRKLATLPVVDFEGRLIGVIRQERMIAAAQEETSADMQTMVGVSRDERALSNVSFAVKMRLPWLQINLITAFIASAVVGLFENTIARFTALAILLPVVAGQSGNTGSQALAVTMRGLALREIRIRDWPRMVWKESRTGAINGVAVALTTALGVYLWSKSAGLAMVIGVSMVFSMTAAGASGAAIPMILIKLGQDPAQSSSIILTTITDVVGFLSFLGLATLMASML